MFKIELKHLLTFLFLFIALTLTYGCSPKPSEETMKDMILNNSYSFIFQKLDSGKPMYTNLMWETFQITKESRKKINNEDYYCIEANFRFTCDFYNRSTQTTERIVFGRQEERYSFVKRGKEWYGQPGWGN